MVNENTENSTNTASSTITSETHSSFQDSSPVTSIDPPAADTAAAAAKRYEVQRARLQEQSDKRQQLLQTYQDNYQALVESMETTKSTLRAEKMG